MTVNRQQYYNLQQYYIRPQYYDIKQYYNIKQYYKGNSTRATGGHSTTTPVLKMVIQQTGVQQVRHSTTAYNSTTAGQYYDIKQYYYYKENNTTTPQPLTQEERVTSRLGRTNWFRRDYYTVSSRGSAADCLLVMFRVVV